MFTTSTMADTVSPQKRSEIMSRIRSSGNKTTEVRLATLMQEAGLPKWSPQSPLPGTPDFTFREQRVCVFVHGCF
jgi:DNA mismatch endonuclease (patch repair protein)